MVRWWRMLSRVEDLRPSQFDGLAVGMLKQSSGQGRGDDQKLSRLAETTHFRLFVERSKLLDISSP